MNTITVANMINGVIEWDELLTRIPSSPHKYKNNFDNLLIKFTTVICALKANDAFSSHLFH